MTDAAAPPLLAGRRILYAEDVPAIRRLYTTVMTRAGAEVTAVEDGYAALHAWKARRDEGDWFDAAVLDHRMPGLDGTGLSLALYCSGFRGRLIGLTAGIEPDVEAEWRTAGCSAVLSKSMPLPELLERIAAECRLSRLPGLSAG